MQLDYHDPSSEDIPDAITQKNPHTKKTQHSQLSELIITLFCIIYSPWVYCKFAFMLIPLKAIYSLPPSPRECVLSKSHRTALISRTPRSLPLASSNCWLLFCYVTAKKPRRAETADAGLGESMAPDRTIFNSHISHLMPDFNLFCINSSKLTELYIKLLTVDLIIIFVNCMDMRWTISHTSANTKKSSRKSHTPAETPKAGARP